MPEHRVARRPHPPRGSAPTHSDLPYWGFPHKGFLCVSPASRGHRKEAEHSLSGVCSVWSRVFLRPGHDVKEPPDTEVLSSRKPWARPCLLRKMSESEKGDHHLGEAGETEICGGGITYSESQLAKADLEATGKPHCE